MTAFIHSAQRHLLEATGVRVEVDISGGLHAFSIVGLPDKAVEEAKDRVAAAIKNSGYTSPKSQNQKIVISLAPAHLKKEGAVFDLAMALGYLLADHSDGNDVSFDPSGRIFAGELALDGTLRPIHGALSLAKYARDNGFYELFVPAENAQEAALIDNVTVYGAPDLASVVAHLTGTSELPATAPDTAPATATVPRTDMRDVRGQENAKRGLAIAAAGGHNAAMSGPPGTGKSMLADAFRGILPTPTFDELLEITGIHSAAGELDEPMVRERPFRAPHHTASYSAIIGGGGSGTISPGEATLAHGGVLFLDEFPEFDRRVMESLRQPLEEGYVRIARSAGASTFPATFITLIAMNPCPCGNHGVEGKTCNCTPYQIQRYQRKVSGPIVDRIDVWLEVSRVDHDQLGAASTNQEGSARMRERIEAARERAVKRAGTHNAALSSKKIVANALLTDDAKDMLTSSAKHYDLSARSYYKVMKLARTIADLDDKEQVKQDHVAEALQYRPKEGD